jgi:hypothetical protein
VPVFAKAHVNLDESHTSRTGELLRNERGDFTMVAGYRVLVVITDGVSSLVKPEASATLESTYDSDDD